MIFLTGFPLIYNSSQGIVPLMWVGRYGSGDKDIDDIALDAGFSPGTVDVNVWTLAEDWGDFKSGCYVVTSTNRMSFEAKSVKRKDTKETPQ